MVLFDSRGNQVNLTSKIGSGGEGSVYKVSSSKDLVAKIFHEEISIDKQTKIKTLVQSLDDTLQKITAWPIETLHKQKNGGVCGFLMPDITGCEPLHHLYSPAHRKQNFPDMDWYYLISVCRNIAASFGVMHTRGHVIGDVNPNLVFISRNSVVSLIDCDSFQISSLGKIYHCEVGVPHFTPPELQSHSSFKNLTRTVNHDNFGLALLIFHVLMMGRHPFSGIYSGSTNIPLEKSIGLFLYAFSAKPEKRAKISPPPNSIKPDVLPWDLKMLFEQAFSETSQSSLRPTAADWVSALDSLKQRLKQCNQSSNHKYYNHLSTCPWCDSEKHGIYYFPPTTSQLKANIGFNKDSVWKKIESISCAEHQPAYTATQLSSLKKHIKPEKIPEEVLENRRDVYLKKFSAIVIVGANYLLYPEVLLVGIIIGLFLFFSEETQSPEYSIRSNKLMDARKKLEDITKQWSSDTDTKSFERKRDELRKKFEEHASLNKSYQMEMIRLESNKKAVQLESYLKKFFIRNSKIRGIGAVREADLLSFGIETAADVTWGNVIQVSGFGDAYTRELVDWRKGKERRFVFNASKAIDPVEIARVKNKFIKLKNNLENILLSGPEQLMKEKQHIQQKQQTLAPLVFEALREVEQKKADLEILK